MAKVHVYRSRAPPLSELELMSYVDEGYKPVFLGPADEDQYWCKMVSDDPFEQRIQQAYRYISHNLDDGTVVMEAVRDRGLLARIQECLNHDVVELRRRCEQFHKPLSALEIRRMRRLGIAVRVDSISGRFHLSFPG